MKWILISLLLVFGCGAMWSQEDLSKIPRKINKIVLTNDSSAMANYRMCKRIMASNNIEIGTQDAEVYQIKTGIMPVKKGSSLLYCVLWCKDSTIIIKGMWNMGMTINIGLVSHEASWEEVANKGMGGSPLNKAFRAFNDFALLFKTKNIFYEIAQ